MKRIIIFCLIAALIITGCLCLPVTAEKSDGKRPDIFQYDQQGNIIGLVDGVYCACPNHLDGSQPYAPGEVYQDGTVNANDALYVLKVSVTFPWWRYPGFKDGLVCPTIWTQDVNNDQKIGADDALDILKFSVGKIDRFARQPYYPETASPDTATPDTPTDI